MKIINSPSQQGDFCNGSTTLDNCYFIVGNSTFRQATEISNGFRFSSINGNIFSLLLWKQIDLELKEIKST